MTEDLPAPETMREIVADYVRAVHTTYLDHVRHLPPGERGTLPLRPGREVTVVAAAARRLHLVATTAEVTIPTSEGATFTATLTGDHAGLTWRVVFLDPSVLPALGLVDDEDPTQVLRLLGLHDVVYHLAVTVGGTLSTHHAQHSAVALANLHTSTSRDADRLRHALPHRLEVEELITCAWLGLDCAATLLAHEITGGRVSASGPATDTLRRVVQDVTR